MLLVFTVILISCNSANKNESNESEQTPSEQKIDYKNVKDKSFDELFTSIEPNQIPEDVFTLVGKDYSVITAGTLSDYNSMVASDGGMGLLMSKPVTFCGLRGSRYTLEIILKDKIYTMSYFEEQFKDQFMLFGQKSGRDSDKMKETTLTPVSTPSGKVSYKEAKIIIECELAQTHTVNMDEVYADKNKTFYTDAYNEVGSYHKIVFGDITNVWIRK